MSSRRRCKRKIPIRKTTCIKIRNTSSTCRKIKYANNSCFLRNYILSDISSEFGDNISKTTGSECVWWWSSPFFIFIQNVSANHVPKFSILSRFEGKMQYHHMLTYTRYIAMRFSMFPRPVWYWAVSVPMNHLPSYPHLWKHNFILPPLLLYCICKYDTLQFSCQRVCRMLADKYENALITIIPIVDSVVSVHKP